MTSKNNWFNCDCTMDCCEDQAQSQNVKLFPRRVYRESAIKSFPMVQSPQPQIPYQQNGNNLSLVQLNQNSSIKKSSIKNSSIKNSSIIQPSLIKLQNSLNDQKKKSEIVQKNSSHYIQASQSQHEVKTQHQSDHKNQKVQQKPVQVQAKVQKKKKSKGCCG